MYSISGNEENYSGRFDTIEEAIAEAAEGYEWTTFWIGEHEPPRQPETFWDMDPWIDHVSEQDDYGGEWAEDWFCCSKDQRLELEAEVRKAMAAWLDKHGLRPKFWMVNKATKYVVVDGIAQVAKPVAKKTAHVRKR